jgi:hypothetical protein
MHRHVICFGLVALLFLAVWLWEEPDCTEWFDGSGWDDDDWPSEEPEAGAAEHPSRLVVYDGGRTTIPPKISAEAIMRIRGL